MPDKQKYYSYQQNVQVQNLDEELPRQHAYFGDSSLRPNTGRTNSYDYALFGLALHELLDKLRQAIITTCLVALFYNVLFILRNILKPVSLFFSIVCGILVGTLVVVEVASFWNSDGSQHSAVFSRLIPVSDGDTNRAKLVELLEKIEQTGLLFLYHPVGKVIYLVACGLICWGIGGPFNFLIGLLFFVDGGVLMYCWITYPEFRRTFEVVEGEEPGPNTERTQSWSVYYSAAKDTVNEKASLVRNSFA